MPNHLQIHTAVMSLKGPYPEGRSVTLQSFTEFLQILWDPMIPTSFTQAGLVMRAFSSSLGIQTPVFTDRPPSDPKVGIVGEPVACYECQQTFERTKMK